MKKLNGLVLRVLYISVWKYRVSYARWVKLVPRTSRGFWKKLLISNSRGESQSLSFVSIINIEDLKYRFIDLGVFAIILSQYFPILRFLLSYHDEFIPIECENDQKTSLPFLESRRLGIYALLSVYIGSGKTTGKRKLKHSLKTRCMRELWEREAKAKRRWQSAAT